MIFSTNNIFFESLLEKRVKSRFSYTPWHFYSISLDMLNEILKQKFYMEDFPLLSQVMSLVLNDQRVKDTIERYYELGASLSWFIRLLQSFMMYIHAPRVVLYLQELNVIQKDFTDFRKAWLRQRKYRKKLNDYIDGVEEVDREEEIDEKT